MVNKKWMAQCFISLSALSFLVPSVIAQQAPDKTDTCPLTQAHLEKNNFSNQNDHEIYINHFNSVTYSIVGATN